MLLDVELAGLDAVDERAPLIVVEIEDCPVEVFGVLDLDSHAALHGNAVEDAALGAHRSRLEVRIEVLLFEELFVDGHWNTPRECVVGRIANENIAFMRSIASLSRLQYFLSQSYFKGLCVEIVSIHDASGNAVSPNSTRE